MNRAELTFVSMHARRDCSTAVHPCKLYRLDAQQAVIYVYRKRPIISVLFSLFLSQPLSSSHNLLFIPQSASAKKK